MQRIGIFLKNNMKLKAVLLFFCLLAAGAASAQHSFVAEAPRVVGLNKPFQIVFTADAEITGFTPPTFEGLNVLIGPTPSHMSSTQIINGKRTDFLQVSYTYVVEAKAAGKVKVSSASAVLDGKTYSTKPLEIEAVATDDAADARSSGDDAENASAGRRGASGEVSNEDIYLRLTFSKTNVVKGEPIIATLKLYTRVPVERFEDIKFPVFNGFWSQEIETPQNINFTEEAVGNQIYHVAVLRKYMLLPQQTGEITVNPAEMICQVQVMTSRGLPRSIFDDFFDTYQTVKKRVSTQTARIQVRPLPGGAPASFGGGVGDFTMQVSMSRDSVKANEAASMIVEIQGKGNLNLIESPQVELPADFEKYDVKISNNYTNSVNGFSGKKQFEYPFIPRSEGIFTIPPVAYSYYDISKGRYVVLKSDTLRFRVTPGDSRQAGPLVSGMNKQSVVSLGEDIRYIYTGSPRLVRDGYFFTGSLYFFILLGAIVLIYFVLYKLLRRRARLRGDTLRTRNRKANKIARMRLKLAQSYLKENLASSFYEELHKALMGYISDKLAIPFADMQRETISRTLEEKGADRTVIEEFMQLLDDCEMARYSPEGGTEAMEKEYEKAINIISGLENKL